MALSEIDRKLLDRCLSHSANAWEDFVNRFLGLVMHVIEHTAQCRSIRISAADREDLAAEVFLELVKSDFAVLRRYRRECSLSTYLTVIARRVVVRSLLERPPGGALVSLDGDAVPPVVSNEDGVERIHDRDEVLHLMNLLSESEAEIVRLYHLEGKGYREISSIVNVPEGTIGPVLSRARAKMRDARAEPTAG